MDQGSSAPATANLRIFEEAAQPVYLAAQSSVLRLEFEDSSYAFEIDVVKQDDNDDLDD